MKALGRRQISLLKLMIERGDGKWPKDYRVFSDERARLDRMVDRGLVGWSLEIPGGYYITETGRQALTLRGLL